MKKLFMIVLPILLLLGFSSLGQANKVSGTYDNHIKGILQEQGLPNPYVDVNVEINIPEQQTMSGEIIPAVTLYGVLLRPYTGDRKLPTIVTAIAYRREFMAPLLDVPFALNGYNVLAFDLRGTGSSGDIWHMLGLEEHYDLKYIIDEWIPSQKWSDGKIGMYGPSYMGITQYFASGLIDRDANGEPTHLKAIFPVVAMDNAYKSVVVQGGTFDMEFMVAWIALTDGLAVLPPYMGDHNLLPDLLSPDVANTMVEHIGALPVTYGNILTHEKEMEGEFYHKKSPMIYWPVKPADGWGFPEGDNVLPSKLPAFLVGGWFDLFTQGVLNNYQYGLSKHAQEDKRLIMGPWYHLDGASGLGVMPMVPMSPFTNSLAVRWFDWKIRGVEDPFMEDFPVYFYVMGEDKWRAEKSWPLPASRVDKTSLYLSKSKASKIPEDWFSNDNEANNYALSYNQGEIDYSLIDPVLEHDPDVLHGILSRSSQRWVMGGVGYLTQMFKLMFGLDIDHLLPWEDERSDEVGVLTFTTETLQDDFEIVGPLTLSFWAKTTFNELQYEDKEYLDRLVDGLGLYIDYFKSGNDLQSSISDRKEVQWIAELNDVFPNGRAKNITSGWLSASHRQYDPNESAKVSEHKVDPAYTPFDTFYRLDGMEYKLIKEGDLYQYVVELWPTDNIFKAGHRVRVSISNSDFPHMPAINVPSLNTIVIDENHPALLTFDKANKEDEGITWRWIDDINVALSRNANVLENIMDIQTPKLAEFTNMAATSLKIIPLAESSWVNGFGPYLSKTYPALMGSTMRPLLRLIFPATNFLMDYIDVTVESLK